MRDRPEAHELQAAMENLSLGPGVAPVTPKDVAHFSVHCPSCNNANPAGSHFCNQCGMPVHFEACGRCDAINLRGAASCHKCGCVRPGSATLASTQTTPAVVRTRSMQAASPFDAKTASPPHVAEAAPGRGRVGMRAAFIALAVALVGVSTFIATEHPATFHRVIDAVAPRGNVAADSAASLSGPSQPSSVASPSEAVNAQSVPPAAASKAATAPQAASAPPAETARDLKSPSAATTAVAPPLAKSTGPTTTKSNTARSKQGTSPRKPPTRKPAVKTS